MGTLRRQPGEGSGQQTTERRPSRPPAAFGHEAEGGTKEHGHHQQGDEGEDEVRIEAQMQMRRGIEQASGQGGGERDQHQHRENLKKQHRDLDLVRVGDGQHREQTPQQRPVEAGCVDHEPPEGQKVRPPDAVFVEDARLQQDVLDRMPSPPADLVETVLVPPTAQQPDQLPRTPTEHAKRRQGQGPENPHPRYAQHGDLHGIHGNQPFRACTFSVIRGRSSTASPTTP